MTAKIIEAIAVAAELTGTQMSEGAVNAMHTILAKHPERAVLLALDRCMKELRGRLTLADVLDRLQASDGRPGADEAWSVALAGMDEYRTVVLNEEIGAAMRAAQPIFDAGDKVGARMAFRSAYEREVAAARDAGRPVKWWPSLGFDARGRAAALQQAVADGKLTYEEAKHHVPSLAPPQKDIAAIMGESVKRLK